MNEYTTRLGIYTRYAFIFCLGGGWSKAEHAIRNRDSFEKLQSRKKLKMNTKMHVERNAWFAPCESFNLGLKMNPIADTSHSLSSLIYVTIHPTCIRHHQQIFPQLEFLQVLSRKNSHLRCLVWKIDIEENKCSLNQIACAKIRVFFAPARLH